MMIYDDYVDNVLPKFIHLGSIYTIRVHGRKKTTVHTAYEHEKCVCIVYSHLYVRRKAAV